MYAIILVFIIFATVHGWKLRWNAGNLPIFGSEKVYEAWQQFGSTVTEPPAECPYYRLMLSPLIPRVVTLLPGAGMQTNKQARAVLNVAIDCCCLPKAYEYVILYINGSSLRFQIYGIYIDCNW